MEEITITRTGDRPLCFKGERIAHASSDYDSTVKRWHEISVYLTMSFNPVGYVGEIFVTVVEWCTIWPGELNHTSAELLKSENEVIDYLRSFNPIEHLVGFPPSLNYAEKQRRIEREITSRWLRALTEVFGNFGPERINT